MKNALRLAALVLLATAAQAQNYTTIIDNLPTCIGNKNGRIISVSDAVDEADCSVGGATGLDRVVHGCICDTLNTLGPYWKALGGAVSVDLSDYVLVTKNGQQSVTATGAGNDITITGADKATLRGKAGTGGYIESQQALQLLYMDAADSIAVSPTGIEALGVDISMIGSATSSYGSDDGGGGAIGRLTFDSSSSTESYGTLLANGSSFGSMVLDSQGIGSSRAKIELTADTTGGSSIDARVITQGNTLAALINADEDSIDLGVPNVVFTVSAASVRSALPIGAQSSAATLPTCDTTLAPSGITVFMWDETTGTGTLCACPEGADWVVVAPVTGTCS